MVISRLILIIYVFMMLSGKFDPAAGLAQSGIAGTGPPEPPDDTTASSTTPSVPAGAANSPHTTAPTSEVKKDDQDKSKEPTDVDQSQMDISKKEDESKENEEDAKSVADSEAIEAKEKKIGRAHV